MQTTEIRLKLISNDPEFRAERLVLHELVGPVIQKFCLERFDCDFIVLLGEKLWNTRVVDKIPVDHYQQFSEVVDPNDVVFLEILSKKYIWTDTSDEYVLQEPGLTESQIAYCSTVFENVAQQLIDRGVYTEQQMSPYLKSDIERFTELITSNKELAERCICFHRRIHGVPSDVPEDTKALNTIQSELVHATQLFDTRITPKRPKPFLAVEDLQRCASIRENLVDHVPGVQADRVQLPPSVLNKLTDLYHKPRDKYTRMEAQNVLLRNVRAELSSFESVKPDLFEGKDGYVHYLAAFAYSIQRALKHGIARLFDTVPRQLNERYQTSLTIEAETHYQLLMNPTSPVSCEKESTTSIKDGQLPVELKEAITVGSRDRELSNLLSYLSGNMKIPALLYGAPGMGKSYLLRWLVDYYRKSELRSQKISRISMDKETDGPPNNTNPIVLVCCMGQTSLSCTLQAVLLRCIEELATKLQIHPVLKSVSSICEYAEAVYMLSYVLKFATAKQRVLLVMDNVENIYPQEHIEMFRWLPEQLPNTFVRIVLTTSSESVMAGFCSRYGNGCCIRLGPCINGGDFMAKPIVTCVASRLKTLPGQCMSMDSFNLSNKSRELANEGVQRNNTPSYINTLISILAWHDSGKSPCSIANLPMELSSLYAVYMKQIHDYHTKRNRLFSALFRLTVYLACSRVGLTLNELIGLLRIDSIVEAELDQRKSDDGTSIFSVGCLLKLLYTPEFGLFNLIMFVHTDNRCVITLRSNSIRHGIIEFWTQTFKGTTAAAAPAVIAPQTYESDNAVGGGGGESPTLDSEETLGVKSTKISVSMLATHQAIANYWSRCSQNGTTQQSRLSSDVDIYTNFTTVYYWQAQFPPSPNKAKSVPLGVSLPTWICHSRRLTDFPYQLVQVGSSRIQDVYRFTVFSFDFLLAKLLERRRLNDLLAELYFMRQINEIRACDELNLLLRLLRQLAVRIIKIPILLSVELAGRIGHLVSSDTAFLGRLLLGSLDRWAVRSNCLLPLLPLCYSAPLLPELISIRFVGLPELSSLIQLTPDQRFLCTQAYANDPVNGNAEMLITTWEVTTLTKAAVINLGSWPDYTFHAMYFPCQQNSIVLLHYKTIQLDRGPQSQGFLVVNLDSGRVDGYIELPDAAIMDSLCVSRSCLLIGTEDGTTKKVNESPGQGTAELYMTAYSIGSGRVVSKHLEDIPHPCTIIPGERFFIGPASWTVLSQGTSDEARKTPTSKERRAMEQHKRTNALQVRQFNVPKKPMAWLICTSKPSALQSHSRGEYLFVGCEQYGQICRFDMSQVGTKEVRRLAPTLNFSLDESVKQLIPADVDWSIYKSTPPEFDWDVNTFRLVCQKIPKIRVQQLWISPDDRLIAALFVYLDLIRIVGIWHLGTKQLITGFNSYPDSELSWGTDLSRNVLIHFVRSSTQHSWFELIDLGQKQTIPTGAQNIFQVLTSKLLPKDSQKRVLRFPGFGIPIDECYFVRGGSVVIAMGGELSLSSVAVLISRVTSVDRYGPSSIGCQLPRSVYHEKLDIIYAMDWKRNKLFSYFNLVTQQLSRIHSGTSSDETDDDYLFGEPLLQSLPSEVYFSNDADVVLLVYGLRGHSSDADTYITPPKIVHKGYDYLKPHLPKTNYYTSQLQTESSDIDLSTNTAGAAFEHTVLRIYDLTSLSDGGTGLRCQISLLGESILQLTTKHGLYTLRPEHASNSKLPDILESPRKTKDKRDGGKPTAIISRYSPRSGEFLGYVYCDHPVMPGAQFVGEEDYLLVCCGHTGRWLRLLTAPELSTVHCEINVEEILRQHDDFARIAKVDRIFACVNQPTTAVVQYTWPEQKGSFRIATFNMVASAQNILVAQFETADRLVDVSPDGEFAIDTRLRVYSLQQGVVLGELTSSMSLGSMLGSEQIIDMEEDLDILCARLTPDRMYIITVIDLPKKHTRSQWLVVIMNSAPLHYPITGLASLSAVEEESHHSKSIESKGVRLTSPKVRMAIGHRGRLIFISMDDSDEFKVFALHDILSTQTEFSYTNPSERIRSLLPFNQSKRDTASWNTRQREAKRLDENLAKFSQAMSLIDFDDEDTVDNNPMDNLKSDDFPAAAFS